ncbi:putative RNase H-like HicB family nuclease [Paenibacillus endophyticus]|uniref:Putative RNase H-like HicB family nuclease n=1 Tax=Paenibacillus endophyticus TaxID=1294268 RepID=A0A7W5GCW0_9BACL|nr:type II toxin-antitoxin system HicB family antitoxin [Paenibacillus endophyticus]MBB3155814.1 putative RNase H-like HicB family nuclease [Paenibacillus endophyticus]
MSKDIAYYMTRSYNFISEYIPESNNRTGYYFGLIEELPGCHAFGTTMVKMLKEIEVVKKEYFESRLKNNQFIPEPCDMSQRRPSHLSIQIRGVNINTTVN